MEVVIRDEIKDVFSSVGVNDIASFIENEAIMMLLSKESKYRAEYNFFKDKYKAEFEEYEKKVRVSKKRKGTSVFNILSKYSDIIKKYQVKNELSRQCRDNCPGPILVKRC